MDLHWLVTDRLETDKEKNVAFSGAAGRTWTGLFFLFKFCFKTAKCAHGSHDTQIGYGRNELVMGQIGHSAQGTEHKRIIAQLG